MSHHLSTVGAACMVDQLVDFNKNNVEIPTEWQGENPMDLVCGTGPLTILSVMRDLDNVPDLVLIELSVRAGEFREKALRIRSGASSKSWRDFCAAQLAKGAGVLHRFVNRPNSLPPVPLFKNKTDAKTPEQALALERLHWQSYGKNLMLTGMRILCWIP